MIKKNWVKELIKLTFFFLLLVSCDEEKVKETQVNNNQSIYGKYKHSVSVQTKDNPFDILIETFPSKSLPLIDSTSFDTDLKTNYLSSDELEVLQLKQIEEEIGYFDQTSPHYKIKLSDNFKSIIVITHSEHELKTVLLNYSLEGKLIDFIEVAYDEIAEGWSRKSSEIDLNKIIITDVLWLDKKQETTTEFKILNTGKIELNLERFKSMIRPNEMISIHKQYKDIIEFDSYNDNYDYMYLNGKKENSNISLIYNWQQHNTGKYNFNKGDIIEIIWVKDSIWIAGDGDRLEYSEWALDAKIFKEGKTTQFLKSHPKPVTFINSETEYSETSLDNFKKIIEHYLANSNQELVISHIEDSNSEFTCSIEQIERKGKNYTMFGVSNDFEFHLSIIQWLYFDVETNVLYEYDLANDKLVEFETFH